MASTDKNLSEPLLDDQDAVEGDTLRAPQTKWKRACWNRAYWALFACFWLLSTIGIAGVYAHFRVARSKRLCGQLLYSPAQEAIEYELQVFTQGFGDGVTEYHGPPSEEMDKRWAELWHFSVGEAITKGEAEHLANQTSRLGPKHPELYWTKLDVFHQLHCLNALRMSVWPDYYSDEYYSAILETKHLAHCIDSLRQSIMCHSDTTPLILQWDDTIQKSRHRANVPHTCRNFNKIRDWAVKRAIGQMTYEEGNWMDPDLHVDGLKIQSV